MNPEELQPWALFAGFEGGAIYTAERDGRYFVIIDESAMDFALEEEDLAGPALTKAIEFDSLQARTEYLSNRFDLNNGHGRTNPDSV